mmetsp:Transcript_7424/g.11911  ORF Transcript_7424/g.11911 Transcript_7424/m.11911 type:complete len:333 (-) Transcript_7424:121-1119(-)
MPSLPLLLIYLTHVLYGQLPAFASKVADISEYGHSNRSSLGKVAVVAQLVLALRPASLRSTLWKQLRPQARFSAARHVLKIDMNDAPSSNLSADDLNELKQRMSEIRTRYSEPESVRVFDFDPMVPGQRLTFDVPPSFVDVLNQVEADEREGAIVMVGRQRSLLNRNGVECVLDSFQANPDGTMRVTLAATRFCELIEIGQTEGSRWLGRTGKVRWISLDASPDEEAQEARAAELMELANTWQQLLKSSGRERFTGQMEQILLDLGPMPSADRPSALALWLAGLINPLPALGVALEIRPQVLMARETKERLQIAELGIRDSIERLRQPGSPF